MQEVLVVLKHHFQQQVQVKVVAVILTNVLATPRVGLITTVRATLDILRIATRSVSLVSH